MPRQQRSRERYEAILDAAHRLLEQHEMLEISIYMLADEAGMSPPSIYHFFRDPLHVFRALSERYFATFRQLGNAAPPEHLREWLDILDYYFEQSRAYYNTSVAVRKVHLGFTLTPLLHTRDMDFNRETAQKTVRWLEARFSVPDIPDLVSRFTEVVVINDAMWALSFNSTGHISDEGAEHARRARRAYLTTFLPEFLAPRSNDAPQPAA